MSAGKIRIGVEGANGTKFDLRVEGSVSREKILDILDVMGLTDIEEPETTFDTTKAKIWHLVDKYYPMGNFTSSDILEKYEDEYNKSIKLSIISTYLSRFSNNSKLNRMRAGREWLYQTKQPQHVRI